MWHQTDCHRFQVLSLCLRGFCLSIVALASPAMAENSWLTSASVNTSGLTESALTRVQSTDGTVRVLLVTGGHPFEEDEFFKMFLSMKSVSWRHVRFTEGAEDALKPEAADAYDVVAFYDMFQ